MAVFWEPNAGPGSGRHYTNLCPLSEEETAPQWSKQDVGRAGMKSVVVGVQLSTAREFENCLPPGCTHKYAG